jgi:multiple sugar transport system permease protein
MKILSSVKRLKKTQKILTYALLIALSVGFIFPIFWMLSTALKDYVQNLSYPPTLFPSPVTFENFSYGLFEYIPYFKYFFNSVLITSIGVLMTVFSSSLVAFGFARYKVKSNKILFGIVIATLMLPTQITMISSYVIWSKLGMLTGFRAYVPLVIGAFFGGSPFFIFLIRQFFLGIPKELEEAARLDGCSPFRIYWQIFLPLSKPILATVAIFSFQAYWNDYMGPLIYVKDANRYTLAQALTLFDLPHEVLWGPMMAASLVTLIPIVILFVVFQKYFIQSINVSGIKG